MVIYRKFSLKGAFNFIPPRSNKKKVFLLYGGVITPIFKI